MTEENPVPNQLLVDLNEEVDGALHARILHIANHMTDFAVALRQKRADDAAEMLSIVSDEFHDFEAIVGAMVASKLGDDALGQLMSEALRDAIRTTTN
jgi:hypothetical protein